MESNKDVTKIISALRHHNRVCKISYEEYKDSLLEEFAIDKPFLALTKSGALIPSEKWI